MYYGIVMLLPLVLSKIPNQALNGTILQLVVSNCSEIVGAACASLLIDVKGLGRKNSMILCFICSGSFSIITYGLQGGDFIIFATGAKFFLCMAFIFSFQYTVEIYPTKIRGTGIGMANGVGRSGGVLMPFVVGYLVTVDLYSPFLLFFFIAIITSISNKFLPFDTLGKQLDQADDKLEDEPWTILIII